MFTRVLKLIWLIILGGTRIKQGGTATLQDWAARSAGTTALVQAAGCTGGTAVWLKGGSADVLGKLC